MSEIPYNQDSRPILLVLFVVILLSGASFIMAFMPFEVAKKILGIGFGIVFYGSIIAGIVASIRHRRR